MEELAGGRREDLEGGSREEDSVRCLGSGMVTLAFIQLQTKSCETGGDSRI